MSSPVVPALIPTAAAHVHAQAAKLGFSLELHLDVVDGQFVPYTSWPYSPSGTPSEVEAATNRFTLEVDLMVADPLPAARVWAQAGADMLVFHVETLTPGELRDIADELRLSIGVSALLDTPDEVLAPYISEADYVQVMCIAKIGAQGQPFDERSLSRVRALSERYPGLLISVDGSINEATLPRLRAAGASRFIVGSAIVGAQNPKEAHASLAAFA